MNTNQLRRSIISLAIRGRLVPQDPNDEPASELLKRINPKAAPIMEKLPFTLPDSWCWCRMQDVIEFINGRAYKKEELLEKGKYKVLRVGNFFTNSTWYYSDLELADDKYCNKGDLLYAWSASFGPRIWTGDKTIFHYHIWNVKFNPSILYRDYLYYFLLYDKTQIKGSTTGSTMVHVSMENMKPRPIPLPPLAEQERIVKEVERWFACIEQMERSREALGKAARQTKRTLLSLAISGRLVPQDPNDEPAIALLRRINPKFTPQPTDEPLPPGWTACTMSTLCELTDGERINGKEMINLDAKYLRGQNEGKTLKEGRTIPANSLLILVDGENSGEVFRTPIEGYQGSTFKRLVINDNMYEPFVLQVINSHRKRLRENKVGSAIPHLNKKLFRELTVLVPPLAEQERIVGKVEELFAVLDRLSPLRQLTLAHVP